MSICDSDSGLSVSLDGSHYGNSLPGLNGIPCFKLEIKVPDLNLKKTVSVILTETVGMLKKNIITTLSPDLKDAMNYGLFIPPTDGKAGKFLLEERPLNEYGLHQNHQVVELRYKRRLYKCSNINVTKLKKLHSKTNLKLLMEYVGNGDISKVTKLINKGFDPNFQIKETGETPLIKACSLNQPVEIIKVLVEGGAHLDFRHTNGHTPMHAAAILGNLEAVKILLDLGQSPNTIDLEGLTPLYHSIISDAGIGCMERLLFDYSIVGVEDENGLQEIHQACRFGKTPHLDLLIQYSADINSQTSKNGNTPLHICAYLNQESCARLLLFRGADRTIKNRAGHTAYQQALLSDNKHIAMLIQYYKEEDVVCIRSSPKYNDKRRPSATPTQIIPRSRSASRILDICQMERREDSGFNSQIVDHSKSQACSLGKTGGQTILNSLKEKENVTASHPQGFYENKMMSCSVSNLQQLPLKNDTDPTLETNESASAYLNNWWLDWDNDDTDGVSSISGPSQRRTARTQSRQDAKKKSRSQSCKRRSSNTELPGLVEIDTNFLPRIVVLQKNAQGFGFVIRGLKASSTINFRPTLKNPALQYFEEIETNSVAARAGLKKGDFILEINNKPVVCASHEETVRLIKASGNILAMKVVTVNKNKLDEQRKCFDLAMSSLDNSSDQSSIISSEIANPRLSTFARSLNRSIPSSAPSQNIFGTAQNSYTPMTISSNINQCKPAFDTLSMKLTNQISLPISVNEEGYNVRIRRNTIGPNTTRPDSIASTDSFYPMPPPPLTDFTPDKPPAIIDDFTLKRGKSLVAPGFRPEDKTSLKCDNSMVDQKCVQPIPVPPPPSAPPAPPPPCGSPPGIPPPSLQPPPPPPPPCGPPPIISQNSVPKPILKHSKPKPPPKPSTSSQPLEFDSHLRQAIAKRRQQIDNDQSSVASFSMADNGSKSSLHSTLSTLKQSENYTRSNSSKWVSLNENEKEIPNCNNHNNPFQRTRSDVYSKNGVNSNRSSEDSTSRLYLV